MASGCIMLSSEVWEHSATKCDSHKKHFCVKMKTTIFYCNILYVMTIAFLYWKYKTVPLPGLTYFVKRDNRLVSGWCILAWSFNREIDRDSGRGGVNNCTECAPVSSRQMWCALQRHDKRDTLHCASTTDQRTQCGKSGNRVGCGSNRPPRNSPYRWCSFCPWWPRSL